MTCRTCGAELDRNGCPNRIAHARAVRESGFVPEERGKPSKPGPPPVYTAQIMGPKAIEIGQALNRAVKAADKRGKIDYLIETLEGLAEKFSA